MDLRPWILAHERPRDTDRVHEPVRQVVRARRPDRVERAIAVAAHRRRHERLHARFDHHHLGAFGQPAYERGRLRLRALEPGRRDVGRFHRRRVVEDDDDLSRAVAEHGDRGPSEGDREREQGQELQDEERIALQPLEEGRGLAIAQRRRPQEQARHPTLAAPHLQEVQHHERQREREEQERERREERHASTSPFSCASTNASTGVSVITR